MSRCPYTLPGESRFGNRYGVDLKLQDSLAHALVDQIPHPTPMGITAENLAEKYSITREVRLPHSHPPHHITTSISLVHMLKKTDVMRKHLIM
jgi:hypothetical protein